MRRPHVPGITHIALDDANLPPTHARDRTRAQGPRCLTCWRNNVLPLPVRDRPSLCHRAVRIWDCRSVTNGSVFDVNTGKPLKSGEFPSVPPPRLGPLSGRFVKRLLPDCESYFEAVKKSAPAQIRDIEHGAAWEFNKRRLSVLQETA